MYSSISLIYIKFSGQKSASGHLNLNRRRGSISLKAKTRFWQIIISFVTIISFNTDYIYRKMKKQPIKNKYCMKWLKQSLV